MQATYSEEIVAGTVEPAPPAGFRFVDKAAIRGEPALAARLAARKGSEHQDGVFLDLWPSIFLSDAHDDHIHVLRDRGLLFVTRYVGPPEREPALLAVLHRHARAEGRALCYLDMSNRRKPDIERECGLLSTPLGVVQTIDDIGAFGIEGARMRKLRYLVSKFGRDAACRVVEYTEPTPEIDSEIRAVMAAWSREKGVVNKVDAILADMRVGNLLKRYRVYLTYLGERLQNVVVLSHIDDGYITDQEYFLPDMPLGGTEYAYVTIIGLLKAQGYRKFSLGLTWGLFEPKEGFSDVEGWALVNRTEGQLARIFQRGVQNHQYKNKYDPAEYPLYLYRSADSRPQIIKQCMGQFFRSGVPYEEIARQIEADEAALGAARGEPPAAVDAKDAVEPVRAEPAAMPAASPAADGPDAFFDATAVDPAGIRLDLVSDSWAHLGYPFVRERARRLLAGLVSPDPERGAPGRLLGMEHSVLTTSGRGAERVFFSLFPARRRTILQNIPFFSTRHNAVKAGFVPLEIPDPRALDAQCREIFRGGIDMARLRARLDEQADDIAMVMIELCNNAAGGYPSSLAQLTEVSALCRARGVPLVLDITRILRNAELIRRHEPGRAAFGLWQTVAAITACADVVMGSLCKDFGLGAGGILAAHDARLIGRARRYAEIEGALLDHLQTQLACASFGEREALERAVSTQLDFAARLGEALAARGVPALLPVPGHCVLVPADAVPGYAGYRHPREALLRVLYERHGVRAGIHLPGSGEARVLERCIRLALPIGLPEAAREAGHPDELAARLAEALAASVPDAPAARVDLPDLLHAPAGAGARPPGVDAGMDHGAAGSSEPANRAVDGPGRRAGRHVAGEPEAIAIVGMAGRFPGAGELSAFWRNLVEGGEAISEIPAERWDWREHYHPDPEQAVRLRKSYGKWGGFLDEVDCFDPLFFWMAPRRIAMIDPQERLFLEECWKALEDAGYPPARLDAALRERTGVFGGLSKHGYSLYAAQYAGTQPHTSPASMVGRVSHFFDLKGPSVAIDNHCASSLVAVHEACEYLRHGGGELAIAGGVSLCLHPSGHLQLSLVRMLSRDASSAAFGAGGSGYVPGEGVGVVVLKRLAQAVADGDPVHAVIRAGALSHNGRMRYYGQPDAAGQAAAIRAALASADLDPRSISYIEAAASGVEGSDAVEMAALTEVFGERRGTTGDYAIGSVKPAIGHGEASSGMAQLMRAALSLSHATLTPTRLPARLSPAIDFERLPFRLATRARPWEPVSVDGQPVPRRAGVTAIGNGVNAHLVLEEWTGAADAPPPAGSSDAPHLFVLSAQDRARLAAYVERWIAFLEQGPVPDFARMLRTLQSAREPMAARLAVAVADRDDLLSVLRAWRAAGGMDGAGVPRLHLGTARRRAVAGAAPVTATAGLDALAAAWVGGQAIAWDTLYPAGAWRRTGGLPTYPFARERYWISDAVASASGSPQGEPASARHD